MLGATDPLPRRPRRVLVAGVTGAGKTTLARRIGGILNLPDTEIDALYHGPGWTYRETFVDDVAALIDEPEWITEWQYRTARPQLAANADLLVWLDLPQRVTLTRLIRRTVRRRLRRQVLWNGNVEGPLWGFFTGRDHIVRWAIRTRKTYRESVPQLVGTPDAPVIVRLRTPREVEDWVAGPLARAAASGATLG